MTMPTAATTTLMTVPTAATTTLMTVPTAATTTLNYKQAVSCGMNITYFRLNGAESVYIIICP